MILVFPLFIILLGCSAAPKNVVLIKASEGREISFSVELAKTPEARAHGLMERRHLPVRAGMYFIFPRETSSPFWMKDTPISLDLIFISPEGEIVDIIENAEPLSERLLSPSRSYRFVLEVLGGTCAREKIRIGDRVYPPPGVGEGVSGGMPGSIPSFAGSVGAS